MPQQTQQKQSLLTHLHGARGEVLLYLCQLSKGRRLAVVHLQGAAGGAQPLFAVPYKNEARLGQ